VIAQGLVDFPEGRLAWTAQQERAEQAGTDVDAPGTQFILADQGSIVVATGEESRVLLAPGEAEFDPARLPANVTAVDSAGAGYWSVMLSPGGGDASAPPLEPGAGVRDVNLLRDVLAPGEFMSLASDHPAFVLVTAGQLAVGGGAGQVLAAGGSATVPGVGLLANQGTEPAIVVVAVIGDPLAPEPDTSTATTGVPTTAQTSTSAPSTTTTPATTVAIDPTLDTDGDGLTDVEELDVYGTNPNNYDTDADTVSDYLEAKDGYSDPFDPDTDGDGYDDSEQFGGYDPRDPNDHPGASSTTSPPTASTA
jgi:hypothetical protein